MNIGNTSSQQIFQQPLAQLSLASAALDERNPGSVIKPVTELEASRQALSTPEQSQAKRARSESASANSASPADNGNTISAEQSNQQQAQVRRLEAQQDLIKQQEIQNLSARDREVRQHERAHAAVGGQYAGAPRYQFERGPDGVNYAVAGEVSISTSKISGDPQATIDKAQVVRRAALAPAEPSPQDRKVAALATQMESEARVELAEMQRQERIATEEASSTEETSENGSDSSAETSNPTEASEAAERDSNNADDNRNNINRKLTELTQQFSVISQSGQVAEPGDVLSQLV